MNDTISILKNHRTIRQFDRQYKLPNETVLEIIQAAKQAPSWMNGQSYSLIVFSGEDKTTFATLMEASDASQKGNAEIVRQSNVFLLFNMDFSVYQLSADFSEEVEPLLIGSVDSSLAMGHATVAAESLGLGTCVIGGVRRVSEEIVASYDYPDYVFPLVGLAIGKPLETDSTRVKPRLSNRVNVLSPTGFSERKLATVTEDSRQYSNDLQEFAKQSGYHSKDWQTRFQPYYNQKAFSSSTLAVLKKQKLS